MTTKISCTALALLSLSAGAFGQLGGNGLCADPASMGPGADDFVGGYSPMEVPNDQATEAAQAAAKKAWKDESKCYEEVISVCNATEKDFVNSVKVTAACSQVVAGTNVLVSFTTDIPCDNKSDLKNTKQLKQTWEATVFIPLPVNGGKDEVNEVKETSGTCAGVKASPSPSPSPSPNPSPSPSPRPSPSPTPTPSGATAVSSGIAIAGIVAGTLLL